LESFEPESELGPEAAKMPQNRAMETKCDCTLGL